MPAAGEPADLTGLSLRIAEWKSTPVHQWGTDEMRLPARYRADREAPRPKERVTMTRHQPGSTVMTVAQRTPSDVEIAVSEPPLVMVVDEVSLVLHGFTPRTVSSLAWRRSRGSGSRASPAALPGQSPNARKRAVTRRRRPSQQGGPLVARRPYSSPRTPDPQHAHRPYIHRAPAEPLEVVLFPGLRIAFSLVGRRVGGPVEVVTCCVVAAVEVGDAVGRGAVGRA
jgi:hypothetical protein